MKTVDFLFVYEVKQREFENINLIAAYLKKQGYSVAFVNSWQTSQNSNAKNEYRCKTVVISAGYNLYTIAYFTAHAVAFEHVINLQWEQLFKNSFMENATNDAHVFSGLAKNIWHIAWGEHNKNWLHEKFDLPSENIMVCGHPALDFYRDEFNAFLTPRADLFKKHNLDMGKKTLLFVSSFDLVNLSEELLRQYNTQEDLAYLALQGATRKIVLQWFEAFLQENTDVQLIYRAHPAEKTDEKVLALQASYDNFYCINEEPIKHWIKACDTIYNWYSTSAIEIYISGISSYVLRPVAMDTAIDMPIFKGCNAIETYDEFVKSTRAACVNNPYDGKILTGFYAIESVPTYQRIGDVCIASLSSPPMDEVKAASAQARERQRQEALRDAKKSDSIKEKLLNFLAFRLHAGFSFSKNRREYFKRLENNETTPYNAAMIKQNAYDDDEMTRLQKSFEKIIARAHSD